MKRSKSGLRAIVFGLGAALLLSTAASAAPAKNTTYTVVEDTMAFADMGLWFGTAGGRVYIKDMVMTAKDHASDARLTGDVTLKISAIWDAVTQTGPTWMSVLVENERGTWEGWCYGKREVIGTGPDILSYFEGTAEGTGAYKGLLARYVYFGTNVSETLTLYAKGYIVTRGAGYRPFKGSATRTQQATVVPGAFFVPGPGPEPPVMTPGYIIDWTITRESGVMTHFGKTSTTGFGFYFPDQDAARGIGSDRAANGDAITWIVEASHTDTGQTDAWVYVAGGTGGFDAAAGWFHTVYTEPTVAPAPVMELNFTYRGSGRIRY